MPQTTVDFSMVFTSCYFWLPWNSFRLCGSISRSVVCSNKLFYQFVTTGSWLTNTAIETGNSGIARGGKSSQSWWEPYHGVWVLCLFGAIPGKGGAKWSCTEKLSNIFKCFRLLGHTCGPFTAWQCATAYLLKITALEYEKPICAKNEVAGLEADGGIPVALDKSWVGKPQCQDPQPVWWRTYHIVPLPSGLWGHRYNTVWFLLFTT